MKLEDAKTKVRQHVYRITGLTGIDYPPGVEGDLHLRAMGKERPEVIAVKLVQKYWPELHEEYLRRPVCPTCKGTGQGEHSYEICQTCNGWGRMKP